MKQKKDEPTPNLYGVKTGWKHELTMFISLTLVAALMAFNLKSFVRTGGLFPGGFSGLAILLQQIADVFFHVKIPYSALYLPLNLIPAFIGFKYIGKRFTLYSFYVVFLSGILTDLFPDITITYDTLLIADLRRSDQRNRHQPMPAVRRQRRRHRLYLNLLFRKKGC